MSSIPDCQRGSGCPTVAPKAWGVQARATTARVPNCKRAKCGVDQLEVMKVWNGCPESSDVSIIQRALKRNQFALLFLVGHSGRSVCAALMIGTIFSITSGRRDTTLLVSRGSCRRLYNSVGRPSQVRKSFHSP